MNAWMYYINRQQTKRKRFHKKLVYRPLKEQKNQPQSNTDQHESLSQLSQEMENRLIELLHSSESQVLSTIP